jgi:hypothetical protein
VIPPPRGEAPPVRRRWALALLALWLAAGCASHIARTEYGYRNTRHRYSIGVPRDHGAPWERTEIDNAWIAFRRPGPQLLSMQSRCGRPVADPAVMARTLVVGVRGRSLRQAGPVVVAGRRGWSQTFDIRSDGVAERFKMVTVVIDGCTYDWTLGVVGEFAAAERGFDAWWGSFRLDPPAGGEEQRQ